MSARRDRVRIIEDDVAHIARYASVPIRFTVSQTFTDDAIALMLRGEVASATSVAEPYAKDYDTYADNRPTDWARSMDVSHWTILGAMVGDDRVGGAIVIHNDPTIHLLRGCHACVIVWDLRVRPDLRSRGIGSALLAHAEQVAAMKRAPTIIIETQQINVPACRLYERAGYRLARARAGAYEGLPDETQLIWRKPLQ